MGSARQQWIPVILFLILYTVSAQQAYEALQNLNCENTQQILYGYSCNGQQSSCQAYAVYRSQINYQSLANISSVLNSNISQIAAINEISENQILALDTAVIAPLGCSCAGNYSQANATYTIRSGDGYLKVANNTYRGLSTCQALQQQNNVPATQLQVGMNIKVPLRCACPTAAQAGNGTKYLLSYTVRRGDSVSAIGAAYGATEQEIRDANGLTASDTIYEDTSLLVPLRAAPTSAPPASPPPPPSPPPVASSGGSGGGGSKAALGAGIGGGVAAAVAAAALIAVGCVFFRRRKKAAALPPSLPKEVAGSIPTPRKAKNDDLTTGMSEMGHVLPLYKLADLQAATGNFSAENKITDSVYRGVLGDGLAVAIKQIKGDVSAELNILKKLNHFNLVLLLGLCTGDGRAYLVYEYAQNGSVSELLASSVLSWKQRIQIALDVANGLHYLHNYANPPYVHKDVKSSNILVDADYRAKITNFGLARTAGTEEGFAVTRHVVGTKGYMAPEYLAHGLVTPKLDVFSFGVVLLELLSGRGAVNKDDNGLREILLWSEVDAVVEGSNPSERLKGFMDPCLRDDFPLDMALAVAQLAKSCVDQDLNRRPVIDDIVMQISKWLSGSLDWDSSHSTHEMPGR